MYLNNNILACQARVNSQYYFTSSSSHLTVGKLMGNPIVSWTSNNCYIQCLLTTGNNWIQFCTNNITTDAKVLCTAGKSGTPNVSNLNNTTSS